MRSGNHYYNCDREWQKIFWWLKMTAASLFVVSLLSLPACSKNPLEFKSFDYNTGQGPKLKILDKHKKDSGFYFTTRGPRVVLKKKLPPAWDVNQYDAIIQEFSISPKVRRFIFY